RNLCRANKTVGGRNIFGRAKELLAKGESWDHFRNSLMLTASVNLKRKLEIYEKEIFQFPRVCEICRSADQQSLADCPLCHSVFYCSSEHRDQDLERHQKYCKYYILLVECDRVEAEKGIQDLPFPVHVDEVYTPLPDKLVTLLNPQLQRDSTAPLDAKAVTMITERLSYPLSLLYALQNISLGPENTVLHEITELKLHVVGAKSFSELLGIIRWEYMAHRLPRLGQLRIVFIGPELFSDDQSGGDIVPENHILDDSGMTMCEACQAKPRTIVYEMANMCYHDFVESSHYSRPDLLIAYNCGFHEHTQTETNRRWEPTLPLLVAARAVPLVFTSYTAEEAQQDLVALQAVAPVELLLSPHRNPYSSLRPYREHETETQDVEPLYFWNQFITCVRRA
ncbi:Zinc finger MYND-type, partial [Trinorchestia longiramus]